MIAKIATLISGVLAVVLPNVGAFNLPTDVQTGITVVGGALLGILAWLEHPTTKAAAKAPVVQVTSAQKGS